MPVRKKLCGCMDFDGLHMDDYFYPTTDPSFDADAYASYQASGGWSWPSSGERPWMIWFTSFTK